MRVPGRLVAALCLLCAGWWLAIGGACPVSSVQHPATVGVVGPADGLIGLPTNGGARPVEVVAGGTARGRFLVSNRLPCPARIAFIARGSCVELTVAPLVLPAGAGRWTDVVVSASKFAVPVTLVVEVTGVVSWPGGCGRIEFSLPVRVVPRKDGG